jgi:hypothetical protein
MNVLWSDVFICAHDRCPGMARHVASRQSTCASAFIVAAVATTLIIARVQPLGNPLGP